MDKSILLERVVNTFVKKVLKEEKIGNGDSIFAKNDVEKILLTLSCLKENLRVFFVVSNAKKVNKFYSYFKTFLREEQLAKLLNYDVLPFEPLSPSVTEKAVRLNTLNRSLSYPSNLLIVASVEGILRSTMPPVDFAEHSFHIKRNDEWRLAKLTNILLSVGYERVDTVREYGQFAVRGGILDLYSPTYAVPIRLEFFGDRVDDIRLFDPKTQISVEKKEEVDVCPFDEFVKNKATFGTLQNNLNELSRGFDEIEGLAKLREFATSGIRFENIEAFNCLMYKKRFNALSYTPSNASVLLIVDEPDELKKYFAGAIENLKEIYSDLIVDRLYLRYFTFPIETIFMQKKVIYLSKYKNGRPLSEIKQIDVSPSSLKTFVGNLKGPVFLISNDGKDRIKELRNFEQVNCIVGELPNSVRFGDLYLISLPGVKRAGIREKTPTRFGKGMNVLELNEDLKRGEFVVHKDFGIGRFKDFETIENILGIKEYCVIEYADGKIYVPIERLDRVQKYIGEGEPSITSLRSKSWQRKKKKISEAIERDIRALVKLYAKREVTKGFSYDSEDKVFEDFDKTFPYIETEDQLEAIEDVKEDMRSSRPMDRLICGDVGYGKTEVALRAAFRAVMHGKQVVVMAPTTLLAHQHYEVFEERIKQFGIEVALLTRMQRPTEVRRIKDGIRTGKIDILIGTQKILTTGLDFADLGLLIVDEEQRFGVRQKEKMKFLRESIDVLTLTATPIPRTLYMSLNGIRDISIIRQPPIGRLPIETFILKNSDKIIRTAIMREINRGGQVFYLYNRINDIEEVAAHIRSLVSQARVECVHGRMKRLDLERIMDEFYRGNIDILVATTIIENGLDIPNANTLIVDNAQNFGIAQLYQIRGRVGRSTRRAFAYFIYPNTIELSKDALERLRALKEFSRLGSGFELALRDMEIRGIGNILGFEQHGRINDVGLYLYNEMVQKALRTLRKEEGKEDKKEIDVVFNGIYGDLVIPKDYVSNDMERIRLYRRMSYMNSIDALGRLKNEIQDRFGPIPPEVRKLLEFIKVRIMAYFNEIKQVSVDGSSNTLTLKFKDDTSPTIIDRISRRIHLRHLTNISKGVIILYKVNKSEVIEILERCLKR